MPVAERLMPRHLGFALYWAWTLLCFQSTVAFLPGPSLSGMLATHTEFFTCSLVATVLAHPLWAFVLRLAPGLCSRAPWVVAVLQSLSVLAVNVNPIVGAGPAVLGLLGVVSGVTSALLDVRWSQTYGSLRPDLSGRAITLSIAVAIGGYLALSSLGRLSPAVCLAVVAALPPLSAWLLHLCARRGEGLLDAAQFVRLRHDARQVAGTLWRTVVGSLIFFFVYGCVEGLVTARVDFNAVHGVSQGCELVVMLVMATALRFRRRIDAGRLYTVTLVLVSAGFLALPLVMGVDGDSGSAAPLDAGIFAASVLVNVGTLVMNVLLFCMIAHAAFDYRTSGGVLNGIVCGLTVGASAAGHVAGNVLADEMWTGGVDLIVFVLVVTYLIILSGSFLLGLGRRRTRADAEDVRVFAPVPTSVDREDSHVAAEQTIDRRIEEVVLAHHLSRREGDVFALIARGRSVPYIAETLVISENTVRSHTRRIYDKLGVHSKQELLDLVEHAK